MRCISEVVNSDDRLEMRCVPRLVNAQTIEDAEATKKGCTSEAHPFCKLMQSVDEALSQKKGPSGPETRLPH